MAEKAAPNSHRGQLHNATYAPAMAEDDQTYSN